MPSQMTLTYTKTYINLIYVVIHLLYSCIDVFQCFVDVFQCIVVVFQCCFSCVCMFMTLIDMQVI